MIFRYAERAYDEQEISDTEEEEDGALLVH